MELNCGQEAEIVSMISQEAGGLLMLRERGKVVQADLKEF